SEPDPAHRHDPQVSNSTCQTSTESLDSGEHHVGIAEVTGLPYRGDDLLERPYAPGVGGQHRQQFELPRREVDDFVVPRDLTEHPIDSEPATADRDLTGIR